MHRLRIILLLALLGSIGAGYLALRCVGLLGSSALAQVREVPAGDQEIAWINGATNGATWERFIAGVRRLQENWPQLQVDTAKAFPEQTTAVPEISLGFGTGGKVWIRWYKLTSDSPAEKWIDQLARRQPPPLALIGGGSSDRARDLARALERQTGWHGAKPLLLITTATADQVCLAGEQQQLIQPEGSEAWTDLMAIYPGRSFRFCFTNRQMAEAVIDFVWSQPELRPHGNLAQALGAVAAAAGACPLEGVAFLVAGSVPSINALKWLDDPYSIDLAERFGEVFARPEYQPNRFDIDFIPYSVGGFWTPNAQEEQKTRMLIGRLPGQRSLLVLAAVDRPARRVLRTLAAAAPREARNLVAVTGDSIGFNVIYRDREFAWNSQELPIPLVFFCHQDPIAWPKYDPVSPPSFASATDDVLLNAELLRIVLEAAYPPTGDPGSRGPLVADADALARQMRTLHAGYFDASGNRQGGSGEYIVCRRPHIEGDRVLSSATIEVWRRPPPPAVGPAPPKGWQRVRQPLIIDEAGFALGGVVHAGN
jgi:hypothetical protein